MEIFYRDEKANEAYNDFMREIWDHFLAQGMSMDEVGEFLTKNLHSIHNVWAMGGTSEIAIESLEMRKRFDFNTTFHLSTEGYCFRYRPDRYNPASVRAELFKRSTGHTLHTITVWSADHKIDMSQHDVINTFEAKLLLDEKP
jgi:hypothetical protein